MWSAINDHPCLPGLPTGVLVSLVYSSQEPDTGEHARGTPLDSSSEPRNRRRLQPLNQQLPAAARWAVSLPVEVQPVALVQRLPRIANALARLWRDNIGLRLYLDDLLVDRRGGRRGFPSEIHNELLALREYREGRYPGGTNFDRVLHTSNGTSRPSRPASRGRRARIDA